MMASPTDLALQSLGGVYRDPQRVSRDADTLLSRPDGKGLKVKVSTLVQNSGEEVRLVCLGGTIAINFSGARYNIPVDIYLPPTFPLKPPQCFVRPVNTMMLKPGHRHVDRTGLVYMPYLHEWRPHGSNLVNMVTSMAGIFGKDPPVYAKPKSSTPPIAAAANTRISTQPPPPPPSYDTVNTVTPQGFIGAAAAASNAFQNFTRPQKKDEMTTTELRSQVTQKVQFQLEPLLKTMKTNAQKGMKDRASLERGRKELLQKIEKLKSTKSILNDNIAHATMQADKFRNHIEELEGKDEAGVDDLLIPVDTASQQLLELSSENHSIEDCLYYLDKALNNGTITIDVHLKEVRKLARRQFLARVHMKKITPSEVHSY